MGRAPIMARVGLVRMGVKRIAAPLPEPARSSMIAEDGTLAATRTLVAEMASFYDDLRHLRDVPIALPDVPDSVDSGLVSSRAERGYWGSEECRAGTTCDGTRRASGWHHR